MGFCTKAPLTKNKSSRPSLLESNMATPAPIASGRYFSEVRLASCLKRMPVCAVMSANTGSTELLPEAGREDCASKEPADAAAEQARKLRRVHFIINGARHEPG